MIKSKHIYLFVKTVCLDWPLRFLIFDNKNLFAKYIIVRFTVLIIAYNACELDVFCVNVVSTNGKYFCEGPSLRRGRGGGGGTEIRKLS